MQQSLVDPSRAMGPFGMTPDCARQMTSLGPRGRPVWELGGNAGMGAYTSHVRLLQKPRSMRLSRGIRLIGRREGMSVSQWR